MTGLYALTLRQPWAFAVAHGGKRVENRSWQCPLWLTELAIHAGARSGWDDDGEFSPLVVRAWRQHIAALPPMNAALPYPRRESLHMDFGAVVAVARVTSCHLDGQCYLFPAFDDETGRCSPWAASGQYHWQLADIRTLAKPVPCRGQRKLWTLPDDVESAIRAQLNPRRVSDG